MISWEIDKQLLYETEQDIQQKVSVSLSHSVSVYKRITHAV